MSNSLPARYGALALLTAILTGATLAVSKSVQFPAGISKGFTALASYPIAFAGLMGAVIGGGLGFAVAYSAFFVSLPQQKRDELIRFENAGGQRGMLLSGRPRHPSPISAKMQAVRALFCAASIGIGAVAGGCAAGHAAKFVVTGALSATGGAPAAPVITPAP